jgi:hypothetical protein
MPIPLFDYVGLDSDERDSWTGELGELHGLERVLQWARARTPPSAVEEILTQDEYTHDVVVSASGRYLVFDTT